MNDTFGLAELTVEITTDEGKRSLPYLDTATPPNISIAIGRNLTAVGVSNDEIALMLRNDITRAAAALDGRWPWWRTLPAGAQRVMVNLCFNMGANAFAGFVHFLTNMQTRNWQGAIAELQNSDWYLEVEERGPRMCARLAALEK
jgi:lysozyme